MLLRESIVEDDLIGPRIEIPIAGIISITYYLRRIANKQSIKRLAPNKK